MTVQKMPAGLINFLKNAEAMARDISQPQVRFTQGYSPYYESPTAYYYYHATPSFWSHNVHHHYHHNTKNTTSAEKTHNAFLLGTILTVAAGTLIYSFGAEYSKLTNAIEDLKKFERDKKYALINLNQKNVSPMAAYHFESITEIQNDILQTYKNDSQVRLLIKGAIATGCSAGAYVCAKAFFNNEFITKASPTVSLISTALIIGGGFSWMFKAGLDSTSETIKRKAQDLIVAIQNFNEQAQITN